MLSLIPGLDPERAHSALAALAGALLYGVYTLATLAMSGQPVGRRHLIHAAINIGAAVLVGVITGYAIAPELAAVVPFASLRDATLIGFGLGALGWELWPFLIRAARNRAGREADRQGGPDRPAGGSTGGAGGGQ